MTTTHEEAVIAWHRGELDDALELFDRAIAEGERSPLCRMRRGLMKLALSGCRLGWEDWEARLQCEWDPSPPMHPRRWYADKGDDPRRLLVECWDGGPGDVLLFSRYLPLLQRRAPDTEIVIEAIPGTASWLSSSLPCDAWVENLPLSRDGRRSCDARVSLFSLHALLVGEAAAPIPPVAPFGCTMPAIRNSRLVLLATKGRRLYWDASRRDLPPDVVVHLRGALSLAGFDVEVLPTADEWHQLPPLRREVESQRARALMMQARAMISVDTGSHIEAATMGCPVALLLHHVPNWRWGTQAHDPWFPPGVRKFFRQRTAGDWSGPVADALDWVVQKGSPAPGP